MAETFKSCSFCGKSENNVRCMLSSNESEVSICNECIQYCYNEILKSEKKAKKEMSVKYKKCSFCEKPENRVICMFSSGEYNICDECVKYCHDMIEKDENNSNKNKSDKEVGCTDG